MFGPPAAIFDRQLRRIRVCGIESGGVDQRPVPDALVPFFAEAPLVHFHPAVEPLLSTQLRDDPQELMSNAVRANVRASASNLRHGSEILEQLIERDGLLVVGAEYSLETGVVEFFEGLPT